MKPEEQAVVGAARAASGEPAPQEAPATDTRRSARGLWVAAILGAICALAAAVATSEAGNRAVRTWRAERYAARAETFAALGERDVARLACARALALEPSSLRVLRAFVRLAPSSNAAAVFAARERIAALDPSDHANLRALAIDGIGLSRTAEAAKAIDLLGAGMGETEGVLELRARLAAAQGNFRAAHEAAAALLAKHPSNVAGRLVVAVAVVRGAVPGDRAAAEGVLEGLLQEPSVQLEALRALIQAARADGRSDRALAFAKRAAGDPMAALVDWMMLADLMADRDPAQVDAIADDLLARAGEGADVWGVIASWLNQRGGPDRVLAWIARSGALDADPAHRDLLRVTALAEAGRWAEIEAVCGPAKWGQLEFLRLAFLGAAQRGSGRPEVASKSWDAAVQAVLGDHASIPVLAETVKGWTGWRAEWEELLWRAQASSPRLVVWSLQELFAGYSRAKDAAGMLRVSEAMVSADPSSDLAQNNLAFFSLLLRRTPDRAHRMAFDLARRYPDNPTIVSTHALSFLVGARPEEALAVLGRLPREALRRNEIAPYYAMALAGVGRMDEAQRVAAGIDRSALYAEEVALLDRAVGTAAR